MAVLEIPAGKIPAGKLLVGWRRSSVRGKVRKFKVRDLPAVVGDVTKTVKDQVVGAVSYRMYADPPVQRPVTFDNAGSLIYPADASNSINLAAMPTTLILDGIHSYEVYLQAEDGGGTGSSTSNGLLISFGELNVSGNLFHTYGYLTNGHVGRYNTGGAAMSGAVVLPAWSGTGSAALRVLIRPDGTGVFEAIAETGETHRIDLIGIPLGPVWISRRGTLKTIIKKMDVMPVPVLLSAESGGGGITPGLVPLGWSAIPTPPALTGRSVPGFTCTGADRLQAGRFSGCWIVSDDGRSRDDAPSSGAPYKRRLHIYDRDMTMCLATLALPNEALTSTQGVAVANDGSIWAAFPTGDGHIRHFEAPSGYADGAERPAVEITADAIDWAGLGLSGQPNGLCFDADHGAAVWACSADSSTVYQIATDPLAVPRILQTITLSTSGPDQLQYLSAAQAPDGQARLIVSAGGNGTDGWAIIYNLATGAKGTWTSLPDSQSVEQVWYDPETNTLWAFNDGGYHVSAKPAVNAVHRYLMPPMPY